MSGAAELLFLASQSSADRVSGFTLRINPLPAHPYRQHCRFPAIPQCATISTASNLVSSLPGYLTSVRSSCRNRSKDAHFILSLPHCLKSWITTYILLSLPAFYSQIEASMPVALSSSLASALTSYSRLSVSSLYPHSNLTSVMSTPSFSASSCRHSQYEIT